MSGSHCMYRYGLHGGFECLKKGVFGISGVISSILWSEEQKRWLRDDGFEESLLLAFVFATSAATSEKGMIWSFILRKTSCLRKVDFCSVVLMGDFCVGTVFRDSGVFIACCGPFKVWEQLFGLCSVSDSPQSQESQE